MAKHTKQKASGSSEKSSITDLVNKLINEKPKIEWAVDHLSKEGPKHKVLQNEILFKYLLDLVKTVEQVSGKKLQVAEGVDLSWSDKKERIDFPVPLPKDSIEKSTDHKNMLELFVSGPEHETLMYSIAIQVLNWATNTLKDRES